MWKLMSTLQLLGVMQECAPEGLSFISYVTYQKLENVNVYLLNNIKELPQIKHFTMHILNCSRIPNKCCQRQKSYEDIKIIF